MLNSLTLVLGVSGIGKTSLCKAFVDKNPFFKCYTASVLIREMNGKSAEEIRRSDKSEIFENQKLIARAIKKKLSQFPDRPIILEGHGVIDIGTEVVSIPPELIRPMMPTGIIALDSDPQEVLRRRSERRCPDRSVWQIEDQLELAKNIAAEYATYLRIPIVHYFIDDASDLSQPMSQLAERN